MIPFHRLLISTAIVFCVGFAAWAAWTYRQSGEALTLVMAIIPLPLAVIFILAGLSEHIW